MSPHDDHGHDWDVPSRGPSSSSECSDKVGGGLVSSGYGSKMNFHDGGGTRLRQWIVSNRPDRNGGDIGGSGGKQYLEKSVHVLQSLAIKIAGGCRNGSRNGHEDDIAVHPSFIKVSNVIILPFQDLNSGDMEIVADFAERGDSTFHSEGGDDKMKMKYAAMDALGRIAYEMIMPDGAGSLDEFGPKSGPAAKGRPDNEASLSDALRLHDDSRGGAGRSWSGGTENSSTTDIALDGEDEIMDMLRKNPRMSTSEDRDSTGLVSAMLNSGTPFPLCRFVSDLIDDGHGTLFRSERAFANFGDVMSDLKQMTDNPVGFLHSSAPDRWKLSFGDKLYGRDSDTKAFLDAANRVASVEDDPPPFGALSELKGRRRELVLVSGHSGAGKSRLVRYGGKMLEERGWRFLRCKFDRVAHPQPLSILAFAFEEYFGSFSKCPKHGAKNGDGELCDCAMDPDVVCLRLKRIIGKEGLCILSKHIPSLQLLLDVELPSIDIDVNETKMASLFGKLLKVLSTKRTPTLIFLDDLQWADFLSLALLVALIKGAGTDLLSWYLSSANKGQVGGQAGTEGDGANVMFVGSYRDNEVNDGHPLARVIRILESDRSINVTNIALSRFSIETLNEMLSNSLCLPVRRVRSLSEIVIHKTDGQPLHIIEFIQGLAMENLLTHSFSRGWEWDADSIDICPITDSVAELYAYKLNRLPKDILLGVQIVSCFGSQIEQRVLSFLAGYNGENSVDISAAMNDALKEGLIERTEELINFSHDMIQKASIDSIPGDDLVPLLRKLVKVLIKNASASRELDSVLFVTVDLINRIGSKATSCPQERALFSGLNLHAALKAITVPDFSGAARYADNGISFLDEDCWEAKYDLSLSLYETAVLSHFSSLEGNRGHLTRRIDAVFEHARDASDKFKTHCVWIKMLSMTDLSRAIDESLNALDQLGEPLDLANVDFVRVCDELKTHRAQFSGEKKAKILSTNHLADRNKVRAMKLMSSLVVYYRLKKSFLGGFVCCKMISMSMTEGHCEHSVFGTAAFASALVSTLDDIEEGCAWGRMALSLMKMYDKDILIPSIHAALYGMVFVWKEPIQSTLDHLAQGIRLSFTSGNTDFAMVNIIHYVGRSFNSGKAINVLTEEVGALARQLGNNFGQDASSNTKVYSPLLQFYLTPLYNTLRDFDGGEMTGLVEPSFPLEKVRIVKNEDIMNVALQRNESACFLSILTYQTAKAFMFRDMDSALKCTNLYHEHFVTTDSWMKCKSIYNTFYEALITLYFARQTGEDHYKARARDALKKMKEWSGHSTWNFENKLLLIEAEMSNAEKDFDSAAKHYDASIEAAREHKFINEQAVACELAGIFFLCQGLSQKSHSYFMRSIKCYAEWGALVPARRVEDFIRDKVGADFTQPRHRSTDDLLVSSVSLAEMSPKKRHLDA